MDEAKSRLSMLVKAVVKDGEIVIPCRNGNQVAEITRPVISRRANGRSRAHG